jgi:hypothetical protein
MEETKSTEENFIAVPPKKKYVYPRNIQKEKEYHLKTYPLKQKDILAYKKKYYYEKNKLFNHIRAIYLYGFNLRSKSVKYMKEYYEQGHLLLEVNGTVFSVQEFFECFNIDKDVAIHYQNKYDIDEDDFMTIHVEPKILTNKESIMI